MRKNFKSDISIRESFYDYDQSGERIQSMVPENVRIEYYTPARPKVRWVCSRIGDTFHNCSLSENGRVLICKLALSRVSLGMGPLLKVVKTTTDDPSFPNSLRNTEYLASTGIDLWGGPSDAGELESESVLSDVILRYGYSAYRLAVLDGFEGTEEEWLASLIGPQGLSAYQVAVVEGFEGTVSEWLASLVGPTGDSAYEIAVQEGFDGTKAQWLASLVGPQGLSAYQVAVVEGFEGSVSEWLLSLIGPPGITSAVITVDNTTSDTPSATASVENGVLTIHISGIKGNPGVGFGSVTSKQDGTIDIHLTNGDVMTIDLNHTHPQYYSKTAETEQPSGGFLPDVAYNLGTLTGTVVFALSAAVTGQLNHYYWVFDTGSTAPTVTWPTGITWAGGSAPTVVASKHYEVSILGGIAYCSEV